MTYQEKLRTPEWKAFRDSFINQRRGDGETKATCDDCGQDAPWYPLHVHHRRYIAGHEPWEYSFRDLRIVCEPCHTRIHKGEKRAADFMRTLEPHQCYELDDLLEELEVAREKGCLKIAAARAKNAVRAVIRAAE